MTCPSAVTRSMYADAALTPEQRAGVDLHLRDCAACAAKVAAMNRERTGLRAALRRDDIDLPIPAFAPPARAHASLLAVLGALAVAGFAAAFWSAVADAIPSGLAWLNPLQSGELLERAISLVSFLAFEGNTMLNSALNFVAVSLTILLLTWTAVAFARNRSGAAMLLSLVVALVLPGLTHALEIRHGEGVITVGSGETIDDTLVAAGQTVAIDGTVNGDAFAFGRSVTVRGNVTGNLVTGAETVTIEGTVGGDVVGAGRSVVLRGAHVGRNVVGLGRDLELDTNSEIAANAVTAGDTARVDARVGVDLKSLGNNVIVGGNVQRDIETFAGSVSVLPSARIGRNVTAHVDDPAKLEIATGSTIGGTVDRQIAEVALRHNRYATAGYYVRQVVRLGAAFLTGLMLLWAFPVLRTLTLPTTGAALRSFGIGFVAAVALPVAALLVCLTIVGLPVGVMTFVLGAIGLYFSKAVIAQLIGRRLFQGPSGPPHYAATLFAGLVVVIVAINLPFVGGIANFALTLLGFGMIVTLLFGRFGGATAAA